MKTLNFFLFFGIFLFVLVCFSCKNNENDIEEDDDSCNMVMTNEGKIQKPEWLKAISDSMSNIYASKYPDMDCTPQMFTFQHDKQEYILFRDWVHQNFPHGFLFVGCPRKRVATESDLWWKLMDEILPCGINLAGDGIQSPQWMVRAMDSIANRYSPKGFWKPEVYYLPYQERDYILLLNTVNSSRLESMNFFTCSGEKVVSESEFYWKETDFWGELVTEFFKKSNKILIIWSRF